VAPASTSHRYRRGARVRAHQPRDGTGDRGRLRPGHRPGPREAGSHAGHRFLGAHSAEVYHLEQDDLYLVGTSEVALAGYHANEILETLPLRYAGFSSCFRREAGSYGKDTKGIIRVHWFDKVEMFSYVAVDEARDEHARLLAWEREFLDKLELAYRVIDVAPASSAAAPRAVRHRGLVPVAGRLPRADVHLELHHVPGAPVEHPYPDGRRQPAGRHAERQRCVRSRAIAWLLDHHQQPTARCTCRPRWRPYLGGREVLTSA